MKFPQFLRTRISSNFIKEESLAQVVSYEFSESFKNTLFTEHLRMTACDLQMAPSETTCMKARKSCVVCQWVCIN